MYIATSERTNKRIEADTLNELVYELDVLNNANKRSGLAEKLTVYKTDDDGAIDATFIVELPTNEDIRNIFEKENQIDEKEATGVKNLDEEDLSKEEQEIFEKLQQTQKIPKTETKEEVEKRLNPIAKRREIIDRLKKQKIEEERAVQESMYEQTQYQQEYHEDTIKQKNYEYQAPVANYTTNQPTIYEATTIIPAIDLKQEFKQKANIELAKIEQQIYQLERRAKEYRQLIVAMDNIG